MEELKSLVERNKQWASEQTGSGKAMPSLPDALPNVKALIIGCADMRVDPAQILGLNLGEAVVIRNIGGRVTPGLLEQLGLLGRIGEVAQKIPGGGGEFNLIVLQHTDCGITRLANDKEKLSQYFQVPESELDNKSVLNPHKAVTTDIALLRTINALPANWLLSGLVYDVTTGLVEIVVPPSPVRST